MENALYPPTTHRPASQAHCLGHLWSLTFVLIPVWNPRVGLAGTLSRPLAQSVVITWQQSQYVWIETTFNSKVYPQHQELRLSVATWYHLQSFKPTASVRALATTDHTHPACASRLDNLRYYNRYYGLNYIYETVGALHWLCDVRIDIVEWPLAVYCCM